MEGRYKNKLCLEIYDFLEKWILNEVNNEYYMNIGLLGTYFNLILDKIGFQ